MSKDYIGQTLKRLRNKSGLTADEVGTKIGKSGKSVNGWEHNRGQPDVDILIKLSEIYSVKNIIDEFVRTKLSMGNTKEQKVYRLKLSSKYIKKIKSNNQL